jgi:hypothetical protein
MVRASTAAHSSRQLAKRDRKAVPCVDGGDQQRQIDQFLVVEVRAYGLPHGVGDVVVRHQRERFGPFERGAFTVGEGSTGLIK